MKKLLSIVALTFALCLVGHAQSICYGAWWDVTVPRGALKMGGAIVLTFTDVVQGNALGNFVIEPQQDTEIGNFQWMWTRNLSRPNTIHFKSVAWTPGETVWTGTYNLATGQVLGTYRGAAGSGRFQATFQPVWDFDPMAVQKTQPPPVITK